MDTVTRVQIQEEAVYILQNANILGKSWNVIILPPAIGK